MKLEGKVAIVTGGSRGIGACIARRYGREGAAVAVVGNTRRDRAEAVVAEIEAAGGKAQAFMADIGVVADCERLAREAIAAFGTVDILVNSAGIFTPLPIEEVTEENWDAQHALNLKGAFFLTKAVVPAMKAKGAGKIVNISSIAGCGGFPNSSAYCATKGGLTNMTKALCLELAGDGINVNTLSPRQHRDRHERRVPRGCGIRRAAGGAYPRRNRPHGPGAAHRRRGLPRIRRFGLGPRGGPPGG